MKAEKLSFYIGSICPFLPSHLYKRTSLCGLITCIIALKIRANWGTGCIINLTDLHYVPSPTTNNSTNMLIGNTDCDWAALAFMRRHGWPCRNCLRHHTLADTWLKSIVNQIQPIPMHQIRLFNCVYHKPKIKKREPRL